MGNTGWVGRPEEHYYYDPENRWKSHAKYDFEHKGVNTKNYDDDSYARNKKDKKETPNGETLNPNSETLWGWSEEVIELPNGDKVFVTPNGDETPDGGVDTYIHDLPLEMVFENYGIDVYVEEYK